MSAPKLSPLASSQFIHPCIPVPCIYAGSRYLIYKPFIGIILNMSSPLSFLLASLANRSCLSFCEGELRFRFWHHIGRWSDSNYWCGRGAPFITETLVQG